MGMYKMVVAAIGRGPMSNTVRTFRPWELPILREIHGAGNVVVVTDGEELQRAKDMGMLELNSFEPTDEALQLEYDRLCGLYGMHDKIEQSNCERVYGLYEEGRFSSAVRRACSMTVVQPPQAQVENREPVHVELPPPVNKTVEQLRDECEELGIEWAPGMSARVLQAMVDDALDPPGSFVEEVDPEPVAAQA